jgi:hypothetical protein
MGIAIGHPLRIAAAFIIAQSATLNFSGPPEQEASITSEICRALPSC